MTRHHHNHKHNPHNPKSARNSSHRRAKRRKGHFNEELSTNNNKGHGGGGDNNSLKIKAIMFLFSLLLAIYLAIACTIYLQNTNRIECSELLLPHEVIDLMVSRVKNILEYQENVTILLMKEQLNTESLWKMALRPVQDRINSLTKQTKLYEQMERIPGGPKSFIKSSLKELDIIDENYLSQFDAHVLEKIRDKAMKIVTIYYSLKEALKETEDAVMELRITIQQIKEELEAWKDSGIRFMQIPNVPGTCDMPTEPANTTQALLNVLSALITLAVKYERAYDYYQKIATFEEENPDYGNLNSTKMTELRVFQDGFSNHLNELRFEVILNQRFYKRLSSLSFVTFQSVQETMNKFLTFEKYAADAGMAIRTTIFQETQKLKARIATLGNAW